jgi:Glyoxalase/Bleomycin resistance protein/Dioxygenase superfamily
MRVLPGVDNIGQVAFVVRDLDRVMATWAGMGIAPWRVYTFAPDRLLSMTIGGASSRTPCGSRSVRSGRPPTS